MTFIRLFRFICERDISGFKSRGKSGFDKATFKVADIIAVK